ncbi:hypothetical protein ACFQY0_12460 [Haloferula chungangensis]|uniref:Uncharacterized protein n=1 Tax=Haloferula chungangensis TaxID=1048331 RepID=A0ABW2L6I2_9BACT
MKESDIDRLLREQTPELTPPPGLKTRVCATLRTSSRRNGIKPSWLFLPALLVVLVILIANRVPQTAPPSPAPPVIVKITEPTRDLPGSIASAEEIVIGNLNEETEALARTTRRTTRFLLDSLPRLSLAD